MTNALCCAKIAIAVEKHKYLREWLSGRASPCQGERREFESRLPLQKDIPVDVFFTLYEITKQAAQICAAFN